MLGFKKKEIKFCKDCKWELNITCTHFTAAYEIDYVSGKQDYYRCDTQRESECGKRAKFFEPKEDVT